MPGTICAFLDFSPGPGFRDPFSHAWHFLLGFSVYTTNRGDPFGGLWGASEHQAIFGSPAYLKTFCIVEISSLLCEHTYLSYVPPRGYAHLFSFIQHTQI